jgi:hypothetical protein
VPKGKPERGLDEQLLEGGGGGAGAGSGRMTVAERWAKRSDPDFDWASLRGPKIPKEIKEERAARFKAERENLINYMNTIPKTVSEMTDAQRARYTPAQLSRMEQTDKNFAELQARKTARKQPNLFEMTDKERAELSPAQQRKFGSDTTFDRAPDTDGMKKGGKVKATASRRADGIASRGKTRGRIL